MTHTEQRSEAGAGNEFDDWHNWRARPFYVNVLIIAIGSVGPPLALIARAPADRHRFSPRHTIFSTYAFNSVSLMRDGSEVSPC
jgi:hypothetical protein